MRKALVFIALAVACGCGFPEPAVGAACDYRGGATSACVNRDASGTGTPVDCKCDSTNPYDCLGGGGSSAHWRTPERCSVCQCSPDGGCGRPC